MSLSTTFSDDIDLYDDECIVSQIAFLQQKQSLLSKAVNALELEQEYDTAQAFDIVNGNLPDQPIWKEVRKVREAMHRCNEWRSCNDETNYMVNNNPAWHQPRLTTSQSCSSTKKRPRTDIDLTSVTQFSSNEKFGDTTSINKYLEQSKTARNTHVLCDGHWMAQAMCQRKLDKKSCRSDQIIPSSPTNIPTATTPVAVIPDAPPMSSSSPNFSKAFSKVMSGTSCTTQSGFHRDTSSSNISKAPSNKKQKDKKGGASKGRWTKREHELFVEGLDKFGKGWKQVANHIKTRTVVQVRTHAQKYYERLAEAEKNGEREVKMVPRGGYEISDKPPRKPHKNPRGKKRKTGETEQSSSSCSCSGRRTKTKMETPEKMQQTTPPKKPTPLISRVVTDDDSHSASSSGSSVNTIDDKPQTLERKQEIVRAKAPVVKKGGASISRDSSVVSLVDEASQQTSDSEANLPVPARVSIVSRSNSVASNDMVEDTLQMVKELSRTPEPQERREQSKVVTPLKKPLAAPKAKITNGRRKPTTRKTTRKTQPKKKKTQPKKKTPSSKPITVFRDDSSETSVTSPRSDLVQNGNSSNSSGSPTGVADLTMVDIDVDAFMLADHEDVDGTLDISYDEEPLPFHRQGASANNTNMIVGNNDFAADASHRTLGSLTTFDELLNSPILEDEGAEFLSTLVTA